MDCARKYGRCGHRDTHAHTRHTGGHGQDEVRQFYATWFIDRWPADVQITPISRTAGQGRVIDEFILSFTHDVEIPALLPGIAPTGARLPCHTWW